MSNYSRGVQLERALVNKLRAEGWTAARSASSKSPIDVWAVRRVGYQVVFCLYQCALKRTAAKERAVAELSERLGHCVRLFTKEDL